MLSVIILCGEEAAPDRPETIVRTLVPLVGAAVKGLVRDVVVAGPRGRGLHLIGDHAGCAIIEADRESERLARAYVAAKGEMLMPLRAGYIPETGFFEEVEDALGAGVDSRGLVLRALPERLIEEILPKAVGLIAPRASCAEAGAASLDRLIATLKPRDLLRRRLRRIA